jgi:hypothetical protein
MLAEGRIVAVLVAFLCWSARPAQAAAALFLEEPFGMFGDVNPTGRSRLSVRSVR